MQLLKKAEKIGEEVEQQAWDGLMSANVSVEDLTFTRSSTSQASSSRPSSSSTPSMVTVPAAQETDISTLGSDSRVGESVRDKTGQVHPMCYLPKKTSKKGKVARMQRFCQRCKVLDHRSANTSVICATCNKPYCVPSAFNENRNCFHLHILNCGPFEPKAKRARTQKK